MPSLMLIGIYLVTVLITLWLSGNYPPWMSIADSFVGIGLVMAIRNELHARWKAAEYKVWLLISAGGLCALLVSYDNLKIGVASAIAFLAAQSAASLVYEPGNRGLSNVTFAGVDSLLFPTLAFGALSWPVIILQFAAKVI